LRLPTVRAALAASAIVTLAACGGATADKTGTAPAPGYPVSVPNCGTTVTVDRAPSRAVANDINTTRTCSLSVSARG